MEYVFNFHNKIPLLGTLINIILFAKKKGGGRSHHGSVEMNLTSIHEDTGSIPGLTHWIKGPGIAMSCGVGHSLGSHLVLLWLCCSLDWTPSLGTSICNGCGLKKGKIKKKLKTNKRHIFLKSDEM